MNIFIKILQCLAIFLTGDLLQAQLVSNVDRVKERYQQRVAKADQIKNDAISQSTLRYDSEVKIAQDEVKQSFESLIRAAAMRNQIDEVRTLTLQMESIVKPDGVVLPTQASTGADYSQQASSSVPKVNGNSNVITSKASLDLGFAGDWNTSFGKMKLEVSGDSVRGTYHMGTELCQVEGKINGQEMVFNYTEPSAKGKGIFTLASDGLSFSGKWLQDGSNQWQPWEGRRLSETASKTNFNYVDASNQRSTPDSNRTRAEAKYSKLLKTIKVEVDQTTYGDYFDYGFWSGSSWSGHDNLPPGYWVYIAPNWHIFEKIKTN